MDSIHCWCNCEWWDIASYCCTLGWALLNLVTGFRGRTQLISRTNFSQISNFSHKTLWCMYFDCRSCRIPVWTWNCCSSLLFPDMRMSNKIWWWCRSNNEFPQPSVSQERSEFGIQGCTLWWSQSVVSSSPHLCYRWMLQSRTLRKWGSTNYISHPTLRSIKIT